MGAAVTGSATVLAVCRESFSSSSDSYCNKLDSDMLSLRMIGNRVQVESDGGSVIYA